MQRFQATRGLERDGLMNPGGPTVKALGATLFPPDVPGNTGRPVDLRQVAARAEAADLPKSGSAPNDAGSNTLLAQAGAPRQSGAPIGSGIKKPSGSIAWNPIVTRLLQREGGHNPNDPSNRGVKGTSLEDHLRRKGTPPKNPQDLDRALRKLTEAEAREVYDDIIARNKVDQIPDAGLAEQVFDAVVNHGAGYAIPQLQKGLNAILPSMNAKSIDVDGFIGPQTLGAIRQVIQFGRLPQLRDAVVKQRLIFLNKSTSAGVGSNRPALIRRAEKFKP